jgi:translation initiation factor 2B subunit (eIF-2B alpha/beta/delta family)
MSIADLVREIREDSVSGASQLTIRAAASFLKLLEKPVSIKDVRRLVKALSEARPSMPSIANMAHMIGSMIEKEVSAGKSVGEAIENAVRRCINEYQSSLRSVVRNASEMIRRYRSILTHSYSSTVASALENCRDISVYITESRPGYEGRRLAERLAARGHDVTLIVDAAASYVIDQGLVDAVVLGCDAILDDGSIANKIGSKMIALSAMDAGVPVNIVTDLWKAAIYGFGLERHPEEEVYVGEAKLRCLNPYFEILQPRLITGYITEKGALKVDEVIGEIKLTWGEVIERRREKTRPRPTR